MITMNSWSFVVLLSATLWHQLQAQSDYGQIGGALARSIRKKPQKDARTTAIPDVDESLPDPSFKDQNSKINVNLVKQANAVPQSADAAPVKFTPSAGEYGDMCCWEPYKAQALTDIAENKIGKPFYGFVGVESCREPTKCLQKCTMDKCNYAVWFSSNNSAALYTVHKDKLTNLTSAKLTKDYAGDSYVRRCLRQYDVTPGCESLVATSCPLCDEFINFLTKYKKNYKGCEFLRRFEIFKTNKLKIFRLNELRVNEEDAFFAINKYADLTLQEFSKLFGGKAPESNKDFSTTSTLLRDVSNVKIRHPGPSTSHVAPFNRIKRANAPPLSVQDPVLNVSGTRTLILRYDWAEQKVIPPVRDQEDCGSCYAFTSADLLASQFAIDHGVKENLTLAPQYILNCFPSPGALGCDGGRPWIIMKQMQNKCKNDASFCEFPLERCMPYKNEASDSCQKPTSCRGAPKIEVKSSGLVTLNDFLEKQKMAALLQRGPVIVQINADNMQHYQDGIFRGYQCSNESNHAVLVTGYDFGTSIPGYIIRNSWGDDWGIKGYFYLEAGTNACGVGQYVTYVCTDDCKVNVTGPFSKLNTTAPPVQQARPPKPPPDNKLPGPPSIPPNVNVTISPGNASQVPMPYGIPGRSQGQGQAQPYGQPPQQAPQVPYPVPVMQAMLPQGSVPQGSVPQGTMPQVQVLQAQAPQQMLQTPSQLVAQYQMNPNAFAGAAMRLLMPQDEPPFKIIKTSPTANGCPISVFPSTILSELASGDPPPVPDFILKYTDVCRISECHKICDKAQCNYFVRASTTGVTNFYTIDSERLKASSLVDTTAMDSFIPQCPGSANINFTDITRRLRTHKERL